MTEIERLVGRMRDVAALVLVGNRASQHNTLRRRLSVAAFEIKKWIVA